MNPERGHSSKVLKATKYKSDKSWRINENVKNVATFWNCNWKRSFQIQGAAPVKIQKKQQNSQKWV